MSLTIAVLVAAAFAAGSRSSLTLLAIAIACRFEWLDGSAGWMETNLGLVLLAALAALEEFFEQDEDLQALTRVLHYGLRGAGGALAGWALSEFGDESLPTWLTPLIGIAFAVLTHHLRSRLHARLQGFGSGWTSPRTWLSWLELGGTLGLLLAIIVAPMIAAAFVLLSLLAIMFTLLIARWFDDRRHRRACPLCRARVRKEASRCPRCRATLPVERWQRSEWISTNGNGRHAGAQDVTP